MSLQSKASARMWARLFAGVLAALALGPAARAETVGGYYVASEEVKDHPAKDPEVRHRLDEAARKLDEQEAKWKFEREQWALERAKLQKDLELAEVRSRPKSFTEFEKEMEGAKKQAQEENRKHEEAEQKENDRRQKEMADGDRRFLAAQSGERNRTSRQASVRTTREGGSAEVGGMDRSTSYSSGSGSSHVREGSGGGSSISVHPTVIRFERGED